jgi:hypothetical protein
VPLWHFSPPQIGGTQTCSLLYSAANSSVTAGTLSDMRKNPGSHIIGRKRRPGAWNYFSSRNNILFVFILLQA